EQRLPGDAGIPGAPHAPVHGAEVERGGIAGDTGDREHAAATVRADQAPAQRAVGTRRNLGSDRARGWERHGERGEQQGGSDPIHAREDARRGEESRVSGISSWSWTGRGTAAAR